MSPAAKRSASPAEGAWEPRRGRRDSRRRPFPVRRRGQGSGVRKDPGRRTSLYPEHGSKRRPGPRARNVRNPIGTRRDRAAGIAPSRCWRPRPNGRRTPKYPGVCDVQQSSLSSLADREDGHENDHGRGPTGFLRAPVDTESSVGDTSVRCFPGAASQSSVALRSPPFSGGSRGRESLRIPMACKRPTVRSRSAPTFTSRSFETAGDGGLLLLNGYRFMPGRGSPDQMTPLGGPRAGVSGPLLGRRSAPDTLQPDRPSSALSRRSRYPDPGPGRRTRAVQ